MKPPELGLKRRPAGNPAEIRINAIQVSATIVETAGTANAPPQTIRRTPVQSDPLTPFLMSETSVVTNFSPSLSELYDQARKFLEN